MIIIKIIKYEKKPNGIYKVSLSNGKNINLYEDVILNNNLLYKQEIDEETINRLKTSNEKYSYYDKCVKYISVRVRSTKEIKKYLYERQVPSEEITKIIEKLQTNGLLNDEEFTKAFVKDKFNFTTWGPYRIIRELKENDIDENIINKYISKISDEEIDNKINKQINKLIKQNHKKENIRNKIYINLNNSGYSVDSILKNLNNYDL